MNSELFKQEEQIIVPLLTYPAAQIFRVLHPEQWEQPAYLELAVYLELF